MDFKNAKITHQLTFEGNWPSAVAFVGDDQLVAGNRDGQLYLWDLNSEPVELTEEQKKNNELKDRAANIHPKRRLAGHTNGITHLLATGDGKTLISTSLDHSVRVWDTSASASGKEDAVLDIAQRRRRIKRDRSNEEDVLSQPGIQLETQTSADLLKGHEDWILGGDRSGNGQRLITGDDAGTVILWEFPNKKEVRRWQAHPMNGAVSVAVSSDASKVFISEYRASRGSFDRPPAQAKIYDASTGEMQADLLAVKFPDVKERDNSYGYGTKWSKWVGRGFVASAFSPDGKTLAVGMGGETGDASTHLIDVETGKEIRSVGKHKYGICDVAFTDDGKYLLTAGRDTTLKVFQAGDGKEVATLGKSRGGQFKDWFAAIALSPRGDRIAAADIAGIVHVWQI